MAGEDNRYAIDIRVFVSVIVIAMAVSFGVGVGLGPTAHSQIAMTPPEALPPVTSVQMKAAESAIADLAAADDGEVHEPAGQVRKKNWFLNLQRHFCRFILARSIDAVPNCLFPFRCAPLASFGRYQRH